MPRKLTGFERMWNAYPAPGGSAEEAKKMIGGSVDAAWISNTCVVRISRCLNYSGNPIIPGFAGLSTVAGADGMRYAFRVLEFQKYMTYLYGPPTVSEDRDPPLDEAPKSFLGKVGIVVFLVKGWEDATGHVDLWDGEGVRHYAYFHKAYRVQLWCAARTGEPLLAPGTTPVAIAGSVGEKGKNSPEDVARVQALLDARGFEIGAADGKIGPSTIAGIFDFQKRFLEKPDGRVDPNGRTWRELNGL